MKPATLITALVGATTINATLLRPIAKQQHIRPHAHVFDRSLRQRATKAATVPGRFAASTSNAADKNKTMPVIGGAYIPAGNISSVEGRFVVPQASQPTSGELAGMPIDYAASFWIGIDGINCTTGTLRAGIDVFWSPQGESYHAWYQVAADESKDMLSGEMDVAPGDELHVSATASGGNGTVTVRNASTNQTVVRSLAEGEKLCRNEAAWLVEDFVLVEVIGQPVALVNFTDVVFKDMRATMESESSGRPSPVGLETANLMDIVVESQGGRLTDCRATGLEEMVCMRIH